MKNFRTKIVAISAVICLVLAAFALYVRGSGANIEIYGELSGSTEIPESISEQAWRWEGGTSRSTPELEAVPGGVIVVMSHGVAFLDGSTGEPVWEVHDGESAVEVQVSPSREVVHVVHTDRTGFLPEEDARRVVALEAQTGEQLWDRSFPAESSYTEFFSETEVGTLVDTGHVGLRSDRAQAVLEFTPFDADEVSSRSEPLSCQEGAPEMLRTAVFSDALIIKYACERSGEAELKAFDPVELDLLWEMGSDSSDVLYEESRVREVGRYLAVSEQVEDWQGQGGLLPSEKLVLEPATGEVVSEGPELEPDQMVARTTGDGYVLAEDNRNAGTIRYEFRGFSGETLGETRDSRLAYKHYLTAVIPLSDALVKPQPAHSEGGYAPNLESAVLNLGWKEEEEDIEIGASTFISSTFFDGMPSSVEVKIGENFIQPVPGAVAWVDVAFHQDEYGVRVLGFQ